MVIKQDMLAFLDRLSGLQAALPSHLQAVKLEPPAGPGIYQTLHVTATSVAIEKGSTVPQSPCAQDVIASMP